MTIRLGFGFYHHMLTPEHYAFARQCGATHAVVHLVDYFGAAREAQAADNQPVGGDRGWGVAGGMRGWRLLWATCERCCSASSGAEATRVRVVRRGCRAAGQRGAGVRRR